MLNKLNFKTLTLASLLIMLVVMLYVSKDFGITGDEVTQNTYGQLVYKYYATGGQDKSCLEPYGRVDNAFYYGGFYDLLCVVVNKFSPFNEFNTRHFINAIFGFLAILFAARLARFFKGWDAALLTVWFLFLSPRFFGECMNNPKDIPFALGMLMGVFYICRFVAAFPKPTWKHAAGVAVAIGFAIGARVGGILLIPFLAFAVLLKYMFEWKKDYAIASKEIIRLALTCAGICVAGYFLGLIFWPYALQAPLSNPFKSLDEMSKFSVSISMLFEDKRLISQQVPWYYIPKYIFISSPIIILLGFVISPYLLLVKKYQKSLLIFLFFAAIFPVFYVIYKKSPLYDGWRHLLFVYPPLAVISSLAFVTIIDQFKSKAVQYACCALLFIGLALPAKFTLANHPNEIVYFNEFTGGVNGAFGYYETDYYMNSIKQGTYELAKMKDLFNTKDTVIIGSNAAEPVVEYLKAINPRLVCLYVRYNQRYEKPWKYAVFYSRYIDKAMLQNGHFPPEGTIGTIKADNAPLCAIVQNDADLAGYKAHQFLKAQNLDSAIYYFEKHFQESPKDESSMDSYAEAFARKGKIDDAVTVVNNKLKINPDDLQTYQLLINIYKSIGDKVREQQTISKARAIAAQQEGEE